MKERLKIQFTWMFVTNRNSNISNTIISVIIDTYLYVYRCGYMCQNFKEKTRLSTNLKKKRLKVCVDFRCLVKDFIFPELVLMSFAMLPKLTFTKLVKSYWISSFCGQRFSQHRNAMTMQDATKSYWCIQDTEFRETTHDRRLNNCLFVSKTESLAAVSYKSCTYSFSEAWEIDG